jgi:putative MATE family efflux protein
VSSLEPEHHADRDDSRDDPGYSSALSPDDPRSAVGGLLEQEALTESEGLIRSGKLAGKSLRSAIWIVAIPVLLQQTFTATVGLFDKILAGSLPMEIVVPALDGIGIGSYISWFVGIAMSGLGIGGQAIIARAMGAGDHQDAGKAVGQAMLLSLIWGVIVGALLWFLVTPLAAISELTPEAVVYLEQYVATIAIAMPLCGVMMVGSMCLHGAGETALPAIIMVLVNIINIAFSWLLSGADIHFETFSIINPTSIDPMVNGVYGIAAGTAISFLAGAVLITLVLLRGTNGFALKPRLMKPARTMFWRITRIGIPMFLEGIAMWGVNLFVLGFIGVIAVRNMTNGGPVDGLVGAHSIAIQWEAFSFMPGFALGTAAGTIAGQYLGAGNPRMARLAILACTGAGIIFMGCLGVVFMLFGEQLTDVISDQPVHLEETPKLLFICGAVQVFFALNMVVRQGLRGVGDTRWTLLITVVSSYGIRLPLAWFLGVYMDWGLPGIWMGLCGEIVIRGCMFAARFLHGGWTKIKV